MCILLVSHFEHSFVLKWLNLKQISNKSRRGSDVLTYEKIMIYIWRPWTCNTAQQGNPAASRRSQQEGMHSGTASEQHVSVLYFRPNPTSIVQSVHSMVAGLEVSHHLFEEPFFVFVFDVKCWVLVSPYSFPYGARVGEEPWHDTTLFALHRNYWDNTPSSCWSVLGDIIRANKN